LVTTIRGQGNNISGETATNHNHSEKIDAADETVSQHKAYSEKIDAADETVSQHKAYEAMHLGENADEQKSDNEPTRNIGAVCMTVNISSYRQHFKIHTRTHTYIYIRQHEYVNMRYNLHQYMCIYIYI